MLSCTPKQTGYLPESGAFPCLSDSTQLGDTIFLTCRYTSNHGAYVTKTYTKYPGSEGWKEQIGQ